MCNDVYVYHPKNVSPVFELKNQKKMKYTGILGIKNSFYINRERAIDLYSIVLLMIDFTTEKEYFMVKKGLIYVNLIRWFVELA